MNSSIEELIIACKKGDDFSFSELVRRYTPLVNKLVSEFAIDAVPAAELFSEGCVALYQAVMSFDSAQCNVTFGLYARVCISHRFVDIARKQRRLPEVADYDVEAVDGSEGPDAGLFRREKIDSIIGYAKSVLSDYEYSVLLYHIQGYKTADISEKLGKSPKSVDNAKYRIFSRLRLLLGDVSEI